MSAVVTGGAGFIGSHLVDLLASLGQRVHIVDDGRGGENWPGARDWPRVTVDPRPIGTADIPRAEIIYHLAAPLGPVALLARRGSIIPEAVANAVIVAEAARRHGCPVILASTSEMYGAQPSDGIREDADRIVGPEPTARMEYAVSKIAVEAMLLDTPGLDCRVVRFFNVAGPRQRASAGFVLPRWVEASRAGRPIEVYGSGDQWRSFVHVADAVSAMLLVAERGEPRGVYNVGNPANSTTIRGLAEAFAGMTGSDIIHVDPQAIHGPLYREAPDKVAPSIERMRALGWEPTRTITDILADILA